MKKKQRKKNSNRFRVFGAVAVVAFVAVTLLLTWGLSSTIKEVKQVAVDNTAEAILASAGVSEEKDIYLSVGYYDQKADECVNIYNSSKSAELAKRQFEWQSCGYYNKEIEKGLVEYELGEDNLPVFKAGQLTANRGLDNAGRWFSAVDGKSASYIGALKMEYEAARAEFAFHQDRFYPVDEAEFSKNDAVNKDGHNHLFTMNFAVPFTVMANGSESFEITADDDTFVFVGEKLVIDMGGVHGATSGRFEIHDDGEVYTGLGSEDLAFSGVRVTNGENSMVRIFHADRDASESVFKVKFTGMNLTIVNTRLAEEGKTDDMQIAYDPTNPAYEAPLGQSVIVKPDNTKGYIIMATIEGVMIVVFAVLVTIAMKIVVRRKEQ